MPQYSVSAVPTIQLPLLVPQSMLNVCSYTSSRTIDYIRLTIIVLHTHDSTMLCPTTADVAYYVVRYRANLQSLPPLCLAARPTETNLRHTHTYYRATIKLHRSYPRGLGPRVAHEYCTELRTYGIIP